MLGASVQRCRIASKSSCRDGQVGGGSPGATVSTKAWPSMLAVTPFSRATMFMSGNGVVMRNRGDATRTAANHVGLMRV
jgi:hypothetical protein